MLSMLIAYGADDSVVGTLDYLVLLDDERNPIGLVDFAAVEETSELTDVWRVEHAVGSGTWPEWIGIRAHEFKVERSGGKVTALVHKQSGNRRERATVEAAIAARVAEAGEGGTADIRDLVGGPDRPLPLYKNGNTRPRPKAAGATLPIIPVDNLSGGESRE